MNRDGQEAPVVTLHIVTAQLQGREETRGKFKKGRESNAIVSQAAKSPERNRSTVSQWRGMSLERERQTNQKGNRVTHYPELVLG